jgi:hypothetical protein
MVYKGISEGEIRSQHSEDVRELKRKLAQKDRQIEEYRKEHGVITTLFDSIKDSIPVYPKSVVSYKTPTKKAGKPSCGVVLLICDSHYGAIQNASEIEGFGEFSPEICERRSMTFVSEVIKWTELQRSSYVIDTAHVLVAGDLISGDIHDELRVTNAFPVTQQVVGASRILASQILELSKNFQKVKVHFICEDNHARLTKKPQAKEAGINSFNYLVGEMAGIMVSAQDNVQFNLYPQYEVVVNVEGRRYLLFHGHNMPSGAWGISWYGIGRKVQMEALKRLNSDLGRRFNKVICGHWHTSMSTPTFWIGGSVSGCDAYDHKNGRYSEPSQSSWLVNDKYEWARIDWQL